MRAPSVRRELRRRPRKHGGFPRGRLTCKKKYVDNVAGVAVLIVGLIRRQNRVDLLCDDELGTHGAGVSYNAGQLDGVNPNRVGYISFGCASEVDIYCGSSATGELHYDGDADSIFPNFSHAAAQRECKLSGRIGERRAEGVAEVSERNRQFDVEIARRTSCSSEAQLDRRTAFDEVVGNAVSGHGAIERGDENRSIELIAIARNGHPRRVSARCNR
jgi:hypothetical protein